MTADDYPPALGPEVETAFVLSRRCRRAAIVLLALLGAVAVVLYAHKPAVSDRVLQDATFSADFARLLESEDSGAVRQVFTDQREMFDEPWRDLARRYLRSASTDEDRRLLLTSFLNVEAPGRVRHLLALVDANERMRQSFLEELERTQARWETFTLPLLDIQVSKDEVAFYIGFAIACLHVVFVIKVEYLHLLRVRLKSLRFLPDPSLLTATRVDLGLLARLPECVIRLVQACFMLLPPWAAIAMIATYFVQQGGGLREHTRLAAALVLLAADGAFAIIVFVIVRGKRVVEQESLLMRTSATACGETPTA